MSRYFPVYKMKEILHDRSKELHAKNKTIMSMFCYDSIRNVVTIATNRPGYWIGYHGEDVEELTKRLNDAIDEHNEINMNHNSRYETIPHIIVLFEEMDF